MSVCVFRPFKECYVCTAHVWDRPKPIRASHTQTLTHSTAQSWTMALTPLCRVPPPAHPKASSPSCHHNRKSALFLLPPTAHIPWPWCNLAAEKRGPAGAQRFSVDKSSIQFQNRFLKHEIWQIGKKLHYSCCLVMGAVWLAMLFFISFLLQCLRVLIL